MRERGEADPPLYSDVCRYAAVLPREERAAAWERAFRWAVAAGLRDHGNGPGGMAWRTLAEPLRYAMLDTRRAMRRAA